MRRGRVRRGSPHDQELWASSRHADAPSAGEGAAPVAAEDRPAAVARPAARPGEGGPWEWDVKRLAASMLIAARDNDFATKDQEQVVLDTAGAYRTTMRDFAAMNNLDVWYARLEIDDALQRFGAQFKAKRVANVEK